MTINGLGNLGEFGTDILVGGSLENSYIQSDDSNYDVGISTSATATAGQTKVKLEIRSGFWGSNIYTPYSFGDVPTAAGNHTIQIYFDNNDGVHSHDGKSIDFTFRFADGTSQTESYTPSTGAEFSFYTNKYNKYPREIEIETKSNMDPATAYLTIWSENGIASKSSSYTVDGVTKS